MARPKKAAPAAPMEPVVEQPAADQPAASEREPEVITTADVGTIDAASLQGDPPAPTQEPPAVPDPVAVTETPAAPEKSPIVPYVPPISTAPPLNDYVKQMEREVQERYGLAITRISHPEAKDGTVFQGTYAGIPLVRGELGMLLSDGRGFGALDPDE